MQQVPSLQAILVKEMLKSGIVQEVRGVGLDPQAALRPLQFTAGYHCDQNEML
jgi:hypothetical protein